ncbi:hypothetical protein O3297_09230 [Janthinobacterium sp. SUN128]|uniref:hypothetical protein n=1 Tax=Janthinobacterium sp. SUN128 TaxID=3014790 RepID=UPI002713D66F|nr:hypothetical protein [Janthinobacterium sp. SUN128]MDO8033597.1 hypothetical protein [Janthinobacterium sp. SUN128]
MIAEYYKKLRSVASQLVPYSLSIKFLLSAVLGILGSAGLLGFLSDYATYFYAYDMGIRPPLEGVPYLKATVTFASLFLLLSGAILFSLVVASFKLIYISFISIDKYALNINKLLLPAPAALILHGMSSIEMIHRLPRNAKFILILVTTITVAVAFILSTLTGESFKEFPPYTKNQVVAALSIITVLSTTMIAFPSSTWWISISITVVYFLFCISILFNPDQYAHFLRVAGYGGGIPVELQSNEDYLQRKISSEPISLILRTNDTFIIFNQKEKKFIEIPREKIISISYQAGGLNTLQKNIPERFSKKNKTDTAITN